MFDIVICDIYPVVFLEFFYQNEFFFKSNNNRNRHTHEIDWIKQKKKKYYVRLHTL
jgi:hypothetical protein